MRGVAARRLTIAEQEALLARAQSDALVIARNPTSTAAGEAAGLYVDISSGMVATPAANDLVGVTVRVTNDGMRRHDLWCANLVLQQAGPITVPAGGIRQRVAEMEIQNAATPSTFEADPFGQAPGAVRSNGLELVGHEGSTYRNTAALTVWANDPNGWKWWETGLALSRVASTGILFERHPGGTRDAIRAFQIAALWDRSESKHVIRVSGPPRATHDRAVLALDAEGWLLTGPVGVYAGQESLFVTGPLGFQGALLHRGRDRDGAYNDEVWIRTPGGREVRLA